MRKAHRIAAWGTAAAIALVACGASAETPDATQAEVRRIVEQGGAALLLDVRTPGEFASGHVPGAVNVPHTEIAARLAELEPRRDDEVIVYCESGRRAEKAAAMLAERGFENVRHLEGDMAGWREAGLPVQR
jgi:rhodanese-related sulfurtransferase